MIQNYIIIGLLNLLVLLLLSYMIYKNNVLDVKKRGIYLIANVVTMVIVICELGTIIAENLGESFYLPNVIANVVGFSLSPIIPILLALVFSTKYVKLNRFLLLPCIINIILVILSPKMGLIFSISSENVYARGNFFGFYIISYVWGGLVFLKTIFSVSRYYYNNSRLLIPLLCLFLFIGTSIQVLVPIIHTTWLSVTFAMVIYYGFICEYYNQHDVLTSLFNRTAYETAKKHFQTLEGATIIVIDVTKFKQVNDTCGHQYGDYCLSTIGMAIKESFSDIGVGFRIGGDEFCILSEITDEKCIKTAEKNLLNMINKQKIKDANFPSIDMGDKIYYKSDEYTIEHAFKDADNQLYWNKNNSFQDI